MKKRPRLKTFSKRELLKLRREHRRTWRPTIAALIKAVQDSERITAKDLAILVR